MNATRESLVADVHIATGIDSAVLRPVLEAFLEVLRDTFGQAQAGREVRIQIRGFGCFRTQIRKGNPAARNPKTGILTPEPPSRRISFKMAPALISQMRGGSFEVAHHRSRLRDLSPHGP